jgi:DNA-binding CsgD family transcriptional regulator
MIPPDDALDMWPRLIYRRTVMPLSFKLPAEGESMPAAALLPVACVGVMFHWGGVFIGIYSPSSVTESLGAYHELMRMFCFSGIVIGLLAIRLCAKKMAGALSRVRLCVLACACMVVFGAFNLLQHLGFMAPAPIAGLTWLIFGAATSCGLMLWLDFFAGCDEQAPWRHNVMGVALGGLLCLGAFCLPQPHFFVMMTVFPIVSCATLLFLYSRTSIANIAEKTTGGRRRLSAASLGVVAVYGTVFGLAQYMIFNGQQEYAGPLIIGAAVIIGGAALLLASMLMKGGFNYLGTQRILFPIMVFALLLLPFVPGLGKMLCWALLMAALTAFDCANMTMLVQAAKGKSLAPFSFIAMSRLPIQLGMVFGHLLGYLCLSHSLTNLDALTIVALGLVVTLAVITTVAPAATGSQQDGPPDDRASEGANEHGSGGQWHQRCMNVAQTYNLSLRQQDVLIYLAKGRNAEYIQKKLVVSNHTAKTHVYQVYRKLNVHSQQELIDLIETTPTTTAGSKKP